jgi:branched-chain amino acid transport system ATP-binding protein
MSVLEARGLRKAFGGVHAVDGVSFTVETGEMVALIGPNGAGKSTCFNLLSGQLLPDAGRVRMLGRDVTGWGPPAIAGLGVGRTFQIASAFGSLRVAQNLRLAAIARRGQALRLDRPAASLEGRTVTELAQAFSLAPLLELPAAALAYGDLKRVELAMAAAGGPRLLLMDEPMAGMSPEGRRALMVRIGELARTPGGPAILFTEHDMDVVFEHADRILVMVRGRLIAEGAPEVIARDPEVRSHYLGNAFASAR